MAKVTAHIAKPSETPRPSHAGLPGEALDSSALFSPWIDHYTYAYAHSAGRCLLVSQDESGPHGRLVNQAGLQNVFRLAADQSGKFSLIDPYGHPSRTARIKKFGLIVSADLTSSVQNVPELCRSIAELLPIGGRAVVGAAINLGVPFWSDVDSESIDRQRKWLEPFSSPIRFLRDFLRQGLPELSLLQRGTIVSIEASNGMAHLVTEASMLSNGRPCWRVLPKGKIVEAFAYDYQDYVAAFAAAGLRINCEHRDVMSAEERTRLNSERAGVGGARFGEIYEREAPFAVWELIKVPPAKRQKVA